MLVHEPTREMIAEWKRVYEDYKCKLKPNRKDAAELVEYLRAKYSVVDMTDERLLKAAAEEMLANEPFAEKLKQGDSPKIVGFTILNEGKGRELYDKQLDLFKGMDITVRMDMKKGYFHIEGSDLLCDELFEFRGLDERDLKNYFLVAEYVALQKNYISCNKKLICLCKSDFLVMLSLHFFHMQVCHLYTGIRPAAAGRFD